MESKIEIGFKRGNLTVVSRLPLGAQGHIMWECICGCGNSVSLRSSHLKDIKREYCGHQCRLLRDKRLKVKIGDKYGRWTVLRDSGNDKSGNATLECICTCGTIKQKVLAFNLVGGESSSCGCLNREINTIHGLSKDRVHRRKAANKYARSNPAKIRAGKMRYLYALEQATPKWLTKLHWEEMEAIYAEAKRITDETGVAMHVDHIVPIRGESVRGLHVPWNLQILTAQENISKSNDIV